MDKWLPKVGIWNLQERNALECCRHCQREKREHLDENITNIRLRSTEKSRFNWNFKFKERNKTYYDLGEFWPYRSKPQCKPSVGVYGHLCLSFLYLLFPNEFWKRLEWVEAWFLSTNCLSFDWWIFDLVTFKNYKRETYLHKQNRCYFRPVVQSSNMEGCVVALRVRFISQFWAFCCNFICCTRKTTHLFWRHGEDIIQNPI